MRPQKFPNIPVSLEGNTEVPGTISFERKEKYVLSRIRHLYIEERFRYNGLKCDKFSFIHDLPCFVVLTSEELR